MSLSTLARALPIRCMFRGSETAGELLVLNFKFITDLFNFELISRKNLSVLMPYHRDKGTLFLTPDFAPSRISSMVTYTAHDLPWHYLLLEMYVSEYRAFHSNPHSF